MQRSIIVCLVFVANAPIAVLSQAQSVQSLLERSGAFVGIEFAYLAARQFTDAIELCKLEDARGSSAAVKSLAADIRGDQEHVRPLLIQRADHAAKNPTTGAIDAEMEKAHREVMARLRESSGAALDREFVREMIARHETTMQLLKQSRITDPNLKAIATKIGVEHSQALGELKRLLPK